MNYPTDCSTLEDATSNQAYHKETKIKKNVSIGFVINKIESNQ